MDDLKKYLQEYREELDIEIPDESVWIRIRQQAYRRKLRIRIKTIAVSLSVAASMFVAVMICIGVHTKQSVVLAQVAETKHQDNMLQSVPCYSANDTMVGSESMGQIRMEKKLSVNADASVQKAATIVRSLEKNYTELVNLQLHAIRSTPVFVEGANYFDDFKIQLQQMDKDEALLRKDIKTTGINNILLEQLINLYQQKMSLLKDLLTEINKVNNQVRQRTLLSDTLKASYINI